MFYLKLAINNIKKSLAIFAPFILSSLVLFMLICSTQLILLSPISETMKSGTMTLGLAIIVLSIFATIMEIYSFNFLMKQRSREFGLYNMLGMNKKQVSMIASIELVIMYVVIVVFGAVLSAVFSNLIYLLFANLIQSSQLSFEINPLAFILTALTFAVIFFLLLVISVVIISKSSPLILFRSQEKGEKEPKGNIVLALFALLSLGAGYGLAVTSNHIQSTALIIRFFIAVIFVIIGTYFFYISFISWYLKKKRSNKAYFYKPQNFITTSQMIFRMKQNAIGLANITLLAIMSFVTIATTTSLYTDMTGKTNQIFPHNTNMSYFVTSREEGEEALRNSVVSKLDHDLDIPVSYLSQMFVFNASSQKEWVIKAEDITSPSYPAVTFIYLMTEKDFKQFGNEIPSLDVNEIAVYTPDGANKPKSFKYVDKTYRIVSHFSTANVPDLATTFNSGLIIVKDDKVMREWQNTYNQYISDNMLPVNYSYNVYADLTDKDIEALGITADSNALDTGSENALGFLNKRTDYERDILGFVGGFLFTGFLLGISFLLGAALIIYYKQYSEGHEDKKSYKILQEVGMSATAVKKTINSQTVLVFFTPLVMAIIHFIFATVMLKQMLFLFGVTSSSTVYTVSAMAIASVVLIYYLIYKLTSRTYYRIIER